MTAIFPKACLRSCPPPPLCPFPILSLFQQRVNIHHFMRTPFFCFIYFFLFSPTGAMGSLYKDEQDDWITVCLKYLLFVFNFLFWVSLRSTLLFKPAKCVVFNMKSKCTFSIHISGLIMNNSLMPVVQRGKKKLL